MDPYGEEPQKLSFTVIITKPIPSRSNIPMTMNVLSLAGETAQIMWEQTKIISTTDTSVKFESHLEPAMEFFRSHFKVTVSIVTDVVEGKAKAILAINGGNENRCPLHRRRQNSENDEIN